MNWRRQLRNDPVPVLLDSQNKAIVYFTQRDILDEPVEPINSIWEMPEAQRLLSKQSEDGCWEKVGKDSEIYPPYHYRLVETFKRFRLLIERFQFSKEHPAISKAAESLFSCQSKEGDIRGFIGNQYATYYTGYVLALLIKAGYENDPRVEKGMEWLLSIRQGDGGWTVPFLTHEYDREAWLRLTSSYAEPLPPNRAKPFSHMATDMVLRAFAAHSKYLKSKEVRAAGTLLKSRFFKSDAYTSYKSPKSWTRFAFWWPNLLTSLESLALLGLTKDDSDIGKALEWFIENQRPDGLWKLESDKEIKAKGLEERMWVGMRVGRVLKIYFF